MPREPETGNARAATIAAGGLSRRGFLGGVGGCACVCALPPALAHAAAFSSPAASVAAGLHPPGHGQVRLGPGPMREQLRHQHRLFMALDEDRLLKPFRSRAGLPAPGEDMGGWYDDSDEFHIDPDDWSTANWHGYIPGHSFGQYLSGLARIHAAEGDPATRQRVERLVELYAPTIGPRFFEDYNLPAYTWNKLLEGLLDAFQFAGVEAARPALDRLTDAVLPFLPEKALTREERRARPYLREAQIWDEPYVLPENLFRAWDLGFGARYHALARRFLQDQALFDPLAAGISPLAGRHAYSHVNAFSSAIEAYRATGEDKYLRAARNGFDFVLDQSYATGGWGPNEELLGPDDSQGLLDSLTATRRSFETPCGAHGHFKIARSLLAITGDSGYGDSMERVLYNTILGARPTTADGDTFYYSDYSDHAAKGFRGEQWPCCSGTFIQLVADYGISSYLLGARSLHVNLYVPSSLRAPLGDGEVALVQETGYPLAPGSRIRFDATPGAMDLHLRIPAWAGPGTRVRVNGRVAAAAPAPGRFLRLSRRWRAGDVVEIDFDMGLRLEPIHARHPDVAALMTGPLALFPVEAGDRQAGRAEWLGAVRSGAQEWRVAAADGPIRLKPFFAIGEESYRLYNRV